MKSSGAPPCILIFLEQDGAQLTSLSLELVGEGNRLARAAGMQVCGILIGDAKAAGPTLAGLPLREVWAYHLPEPDLFRAHVSAELLCDCVRRCHPEAVLIGSSDRGRDVAPMAAARFGTGLTADCTGLQLLEDGRLLQIRPAYGGSIMAEILTPDTRPCFATIRSGVMQPPAPGVSGHPVIHHPPLPEQALRFMEATDVTGQRPVPPARSIAEARVVVAAGCGIRQQTDLEQVYTLAEKLGGVAACSRGLVERGWMPGDRQIGLSGHSISPDLLITLGISGSVQFLSGVRGAGHMIAVNIDPQAPVFQVAHRCLCCDLYDTMNALLSRLDTGSTQGD